MFTNKSAVRLEKFQKVLRTLAEQHEVGTISPEVKDVTSRAAVEVKTQDLYVWANAELPHKIAVRECVVLREVDRYGSPVTAKKAA